MLDAQGKRLVGGDPPILDHRGNESKFRLARDGSSVEFGFDVWTNGKRQRRLARFDLRERRFDLDVSSRKRAFAPRAPTVSTSAIGVATTSRRSTASRCH